MTNEELVELYQSGDESALEQLLEQNKKAIHSIAKKFNTSKTASIDYEDLIQEGSIGLITAAKKYKIDHEKRAAFNTYAVYWIRQKMSRFIEQKNTNDEVSLNDPVGEDGGERGDFIPDKKDYYEDAEEDISNIELRKELIAVMNEVLTLKERQIIQIRYGFDYEGPIPITGHHNNWGSYGYKEVGELFGISGPRIAQIENKSLMKMRNTKWAKNKYTDQERDKGTIKRIDTNTFFDMIAQSIIDLEA